MSNGEWKPKLPKLLPELDGVARLFVERVLIFMVSVAFALAPFLGTLDVPGFVALLSLLPVSIQDVAIGLSSLLMGVAVLTTDFYAREGALAARRRQQLFFGALVVLMVLIVSFADVLSSTGVATVSTPAGKTFRYIVGELPAPRAEAQCAQKCAKLAPADCIQQHLGGHIHLIESCYGATAIAVVARKLLYIYQGIIASLGALFGIAVLQMRAPVRRKRTGPVASVAPGS